MHMLIQIALVLKMYGHSSNYKDYEGGCCLLP